MRSFADIDITIQHRRHGGIPCLVDQSNTCLVASLGNIRRYVINYFYGDIHDGDLASMARNREELFCKLKLRRRPLTKYSSGDADVSPRQLFMDTFQPYKIRNRYIHT